MVGPRNHHPQVAWQQVGIVRPQGLCRYNTALVTSTPVPSAVAVGTGYVFQVGFGDGVASYYSETVGDHITCVR